MDKANGFVKRLENLIENKIVLVTEKEKLDLYATSKRMGG